MSNYKIRSTTPAALPVGLVNARYPDIKTSKWIGLNGLVYWVLVDSVIILVAVYSGHYCCVTSNPKTSGLKQLLDFTHNFVGQKFRNNSAGLFNFDPHASAGVAGAGGYPSKTVSSSACLQTPSSWLLNPLASSCSLDFFQDGGLKVLILLTWQVASKSPRQNCQSC